MGTRVFSDATVTAADPSISSTNPVDLSQGAARKVSAPVDFPLLLIMVVFVVFGLLMVYSASWDYSLIWYDIPTYQFYRQIVWMAIGIALAISVSFLDYRKWRKLALVVMLITIGTLVLVLFGAGRTFWQGSLQPSELAKVITVIYLSVWMHSKAEQLHDVKWGLFPLAFIIGIICGLIFLQPDLSAAITIFILGGLLFFLGGGDLKQIATLLILATIVGVIVVNISSTGQSRMDVFISGIKDPTKASYHVLFSFEALVKGGWFGVGIGRSTTKLLGLPFAPTDSIFAVIAEEFGLVGAAGTVLLYGLLVWRGLRIASRAPDMLGSLLASGLTLWIGVEAVINMLVMVGLLPFAGNALPFISYGGSNLVSCFVAIGILMSVSRQIQPQVETNEWRNFGASIDLRGRDRRRGLPRTSRS